MRANDGPEAEQTIASSGVGFGSPNPSPNPSPASSATAPPTTAASLEAGSAFGRYRILRRLGQGGMGVVYQAWDEELGIAVALKLIRPEILANEDAGREAERRFKRELVLARQVTHKHVVRIHDLGERDGVKYFTMPFIEGQNLAAVVAREGQLPVARALRIARQIASGLAAAHDAGVVHRDLKPENVMLDADDAAIIMDFGLARSGDAPQLTMAGTVLGTLAYMAPEQARGGAVDHRADIYAWGLILYDMLAGRRRIAQHHDTMSELVARMQQPPAPLRTLVPHVPEPVEALVARAVATDPAARFQTTREMLAALDALDAEGFAAAPPSGVASAVTSGLPPMPVPAVTGRRGWRTIAGAAALVVAFAGAGAWIMTRGAGAGGGAESSAPRDTVSVLVADFDNTTGDAVFDGVLEQALSLGIEGASFITAFSRRDAERVAQQIRPDARLDDTTARLVCQREGIKTMIAGTIAAAGAGYLISARVVDPVPGDVLAEASARAATKADVLATVGELSAQIRSALGDATPATTMAAARETFTAASLDAARDYAEAQKLANANRDEEAITYYQKAIEHDAKLGRAYAGWAQSAFKLGRRSEADALYQKAFALVDRMTEREKLRTLGTYYLNIPGNYEKAIENYELLLEKYPSDGAAHNNLALAYFHQLRFDKALVQGRRLLEIYPKAPLYRYNQALYAMYAGEFAVGAEEARTALELNPKLPKAHLAIAMDALAGGDPDAARAAYERARDAGPRGVSLAVIGLADLAMYEGRFARAVELLEPGVADDESGRNMVGASAKVVALAEAEFARGNTAAAVAASTRALKWSDDPAVLVPAARVLIDAGRMSDAERLADQLDSSLATRTRAYAGVVRAMMRLHQKNPVGAIDALAEAQKRSDLWLVRFYKGVAYVQAGAFAEALSELEQCERRRGEATAVFLDDVPTFRYTVPLGYWLGRAHEGLKARDAAVRYYRTYLTHRTADLDPLARDAARRVASQ